MLPRRDVLFAVDITLPLLFPLRKRKYVALFNADDQGSGQQIFLLVFCDAVAPSRY